MLQGHAKQVRVRLNQQGEGRNQENAHYKMHKAATGIMGHAVLKQTSYC